MLVKAGLSNNRYDLNPIRLSYFSGKSRREQVSFSLGQLQENKGIENAANSRKENRIYPQINYGVEFIFAPPQHLHFVYWARLSQTDRDGTDIQFDWFGGVLDVGGYDARFHDQG